MKEGAEVLADAILAGDRGALARGITLVESSRADHRERAFGLLERLAPHAGRSLRVGISGVPGVGKSSLIEALGTHLISEGHRVAVLAVDPSSRLSGGSILGDKTRMPRLAADPAAFVRPSATGGTLGGVTGRTREAIVLCEAGGYDVVVVETVGVGQSETAVADMTDVFVLLLLPGGGDELQGIKRGIVELADLVLVNKADGDLEAAAGRAAAEYRSALRLLSPRAPGWSVPVETCSALEGRGIREAWRIVERFRDAMAASGRLTAHRAEQAVGWMWAETTATLLARLRESPAVTDQVDATESRVRAGELPPTVAAATLVEAFLGGSDRDPPR